MYISHCVYRSVYHMGTYVILTTAMTPYLRKPVLRSCTSRADSADRVRGGHHGREVFGQRTAQELRHPAEWLGATCSTPAEVTLLQQFTLPPSLCRQPL